MKVSVIIPFHGGKSFLEDCLQSLEEQEFQDFETILINDHSTELIQPLVQTYQENHKCIYLELEEGKTGVAAARNLGLAYATGTYLYFLDSDDYLYEGALQALVESAEEKQADIVYGKRKTTWFKRSVFLSTFVLEEETTGNEEDDEVASAQLALEEGNAIEQQDQEEDGLTEEERYQNTQRNRAYRTLITKRRGIKNISVLHILFRKSFIDQYKIRFQEEFLFYSDLSFVLQAMEHATIYERQYDALYIKRKHNDPIHFPALSQRKEEDRFYEYVKAYQYTIQQLDKDGEARERLDRKIIAFYTNFFVTRVRRSLNDTWRTDRFALMQELVCGMDPALLRRYKGYRRRLLRALVKGNLAKTKRLVNRHLAYQKAKQILRNKRELAKFLYLHVFLKRPVKSNWVLCESFFGKSYSDSPKYLYEYLAKTYPGKYRFIWVLNEKKKLPYPATRVKRFSIRYAYYLARCKYYFFNVRQPGWVRKREGNVFLETWHGTPLKKLVFDQEEVCAASPLYKAQFYKNSRMWDFLVAANAFSANIFRSAFLYENRILEYGYPRNDILHAKDKEEKAEQIKQRLHLPKGKKVILYAPTWRDDEFYEKGKYKFQLQLNLWQLKEALGDQYIILLRAHYYIADAIDTTGLEGFAYNVSKYDDISELYLISDLLITDYSSVFFDYANLRRPILFFTYDLEKYRDVLRGFYIKMEEEVPGPLLFTTEEVITAIQTIDDVSARYAQKYEQFYQKFCSYEDGHASENIIKEVFSLKE